MKIQVNFKLKSLGIGRIGPSGSIKSFWYNMKLNVFTVHF